MKSIPISKEWLINLGFEKISEIKYCSPQFKCNRIYINIDDDFAHWNADMFFGVTIRYVHQLQNLYFVLTGEELVLS